MKKQSLHIYKTEHVDPYVLIRDLRAWTKKELKGTNTANPHIHLGFLAATAILDLMAARDAKEQHLRDIKRAIETLRNI